jgi:lipoate-protein ligase A
MAFACRLIIDPPAAGAWNMAADEALLMNACEHGSLTVRFYQWDEPTLSLGYFQRYADRLRHPPSRVCPVVRRQTGGGAIVHDRELTYSITLPAGHPLARQSRLLYATAHDAFIGAIEPAISGANAAWAVMRREDFSNPSRREEPFLCFQRQAHGDVLLVASGSQANDSRLQPASATHGKILGSAQRRFRGAVLQHGSLLLETSPAAPELAGLRELTGVRLDLRQLALDVAGRICVAMGATLEETLFPAGLESLARQIANTRYSDTRWTRRR